MSHNRRELALEPPPGIEIPRQEAHSSGVYSDRRALRPRLFESASAWRPARRLRRRGNVKPVSWVFGSRLGTATLVAENSLAVAFDDAFPVSPGHCLVVPRRHEPDFFALTAEEQTAMWSLVAPVSPTLQRAGRWTASTLGSTSVRLRGRRLLTLTSM
jgi:HIT domain